MIESELDDDRCGLDAGDGWETLLDYFLVFRLAGDGAVASKSHGVILERHSHRCRRSVCNGRYSPLNNRFERSSVISETEFMTTFHLLLSPQIKSTHSV